MSDTTATDLLNELLAAFEDCPYVNKFVLVAEIIGDDGLRAGTVAPSGGAAKWDVLGLLQWALNEESADQTVTAFLDADDDD